MSFYSMLTKYYDHIFPVSVKAVDFLAQRYASTPGGKILDLGCGPGGYAVSLAERGFRVTGIDLESEMIERARTIAERRGVQDRTEFYCMDLRDVNELAQTFDGAYCIGNTLVHLHDGQEVRALLKSIHEMLRPNAPLLIQILNYDWILNKRVEELPLIENPEVDLQFKRRYVLPEDPGGLIRFQTRLQVRDDSWHGETSLRPLGREELNEAMVVAGFAALQWFSSMEGASWREEALPLVVQGLA